MNAARGRESSGEIEMKGGDDIDPIQILVVDDDEIERYMILRFFARVTEHVEIEEAESGEQAMERIRGKPFDLILSDYRMGAVTGIDLLAFAKKESPRTIRILLSGYASPALRDEAKRVADTHAVLEKPMTPRELDALLEEHVVKRFLAPLER